ncbi:outer membrane insertion C-terminal signal [Marivirga sericea]|uniref:Outer membrane insertion C-terminal signal n=1 Tax=Marivirga sericea TaxID=1028 RepID=A0A1X7ISP0_9BACT|nr:DUF481 domain-containing protein [Marivirga sericea]SMG17780.1 outer membrane insertion C-terminal signal [Marivirga sericea]
MKFFLVAVFICLSHAGISQILNLQSSKIEKDSSLIKGNMTASFSMYNRSAAANEPVEFLGASFKSSIAIFPKNARLSLINDFSYLEINEDAFLNTGFQHLRFSIFENRRMHPEAFVQFQYDNFRGLFPRWIGGLGIRNDFIKRKNFSFFFSPGIMWEYEAWLIPGTEKQMKVSFIKSTNYIGFRWDVNDYIDINTINYYQTTYDPEEELWRNRYSIELNINSKITEKLGINNSFTLSYEDEPIVPITQTIYNFTAGVNYKF